MSFPLRDEQRIEHMIEACRLIIEFSNVDKSEYDASIEKQAAIIHYFILLGEAASRLSEDFKLKHDEIEWYRVSGMRNRLVHDYIAVDPEIVWSSAKESVPELLARLINLRSNT